MTNLSTFSGWHPCNSLLASLSLAFEISKFCLDILSFQALMIGTYTDSFYAPFCSFLHPALLLKHFRHFI